MSTDASVGASAARIVSALVFTDARFPPSSGALVEIEASTLAPGILVASLRTASLIVLLASLLSALVA
ncbi:MAG: hypothetical protein V1924_05010 [Candidatus Bathyarchaeota archaeon]